MVIASITIVVSSLIALTKDNLKARLAYSDRLTAFVYVTVGAMLADPAGALGAALQIPMHAVAKMTLFMCAGAIYVATGKTNISDMKGLGRKMPLVFSCPLSYVLIIGIPPPAVTGRSMSCFRGKSAVTICGWSMCSSHHPC